jgi:hypothetical protein
LLFILLEWQREGLPTFFQAPWRAWEPELVGLKRPWTIISMYHRLTVRFGYRRNHLDSFGTLVPLGATGSG